MLPNARQGYHSKCYMSQLYRKSNQYKYTRLLYQHVIQPLCNLNRYELYGLIIISCITFYASMRILATVRSLLCYYDLLWRSIGCPLLPSNNHLSNLYGILTPPEPMYKYQLIDQSLNQYTNNITSCWSNGEWILTSELGNSDNTKHVIAYNTYVGRTKEYYYCSDSDKYNAVKNHRYSFIPYGSRQYIDQYPLQHAISNDALCQYQLNHFPRHIEFCRLFNGRSILLIGDSIQNEFFLSLLAHVASTTYDSYSESVTICADGYTEPVQLTFIRNDYLLFDDEIIINNKKNVIIEDEYKQSFESLLHTHQIVILNKGIHVIPTEQYIDSLHKTMTRIRELHPNNILIWRTHTAGHSDCMNHKHPAKTRTIDLSSKTVTKHDVTYPAGPSDGIDYGWKLVAEQNHAAINLVTQLHINALVLDTAASTQYRPDGHISTDDCLHYCLPSGVVDYWSVLLYNVLDVHQQIAGTNPT